MTRQEQIEEIKRDIKKALEFDCSKDKCKTCKHKNEDNCEIPLITDYLIEQGYQKLPKDSVVLTKEEYEMLANQYKNLEIKYSNLSDNYRLCKDANETLKRNAIAIRKETATNFFKDLIRQADFWGETDMWVNYKTLVTVAKQYGVEVEE